MAKPTELKYEGFEALQDIYNDIERAVEDLFEKYGYELLGTVRVTIQYTPEEGADEETP